jgi:hypothetical protein
MSKTGSWVGFRGWMPFRTYYIYWDKEPYLNFKDKKVINAPLHTGLFTPVFKSFCPGIHGRSGNPDVKSRLVYASRNPLKPIVDLMLKSPACNWGFI